MCRLSEVKRTQSLRSKCGENKNGTLTILNQTYRILVLLPLILFAFIREPLILLGKGCHTEITLFRVFL